jgi:hypothetical protein
VSSEASDTGRRLGPADLAGLLASAAFSAVFVARTAFRVGGALHFALFDDAMISMTYARNLAEGHGLRWTVDGARVEGITNPLWTLVMAVVHLAPLPARLASLPIVLLGAASVLTAAVLARSVTRRLAPAARLAPTLALWAVGLCYPLLYWSLRGMEAGVVVVLVLAGLHACLRLRDGERAAPVALAVVVATGVWVRLDFTIFAAVFVGGAVALWARGAVPRRAALLPLGSLVAAVVVQEAARLAYYGALLPNTYTLKVEGVALDDRLTRGVEGIAVVLAFGAAALGLLALPALRELRRRDGFACGLVLATVLLPFAYSAGVGGDSWEWMRYSNRFVLPSVVLVTCLAMRGIEIVAGAAASANRRPALVVACGLAGIAVVGYALLDRIDERWARFPTGVAGRPASWHVAAALAVAATPLLARRARTTAVLLGAVALSVAVSGPAVQHWWLHNGVDVDGDERMVRYALALREVTEPDAHVAVVAAGSLIYFSERPGLDLLGKSDERIARAEVRDDDAQPGHQKWDYGISILGDRPEVVAQLWHVERAERSTLAAGYRSVRFDDRVCDRFLGASCGRFVVLVRRGTPLVDDDELVPHAPLPNAPPPPGGARDTDRRRAGTGALPSP